MVKRIVNCSHEWGTDGQHQNIYCKKCFISKEDYSPVRIYTETEYIFTCPACGFSNFTGYVEPSLDKVIVCDMCDFEIYDFTF